MQKIILLVGDSGSGKDFVLSTIGNYPGIQVIKRYISREARDGEENSISSIFNVPIEEIKSLDYYYEGDQAGRWYGIRKQDLDDALASGKSPIVVCPNYDIFMKMLKDYQGNVVSYFVYRGYAEDEIEEWRRSLRNRGSSLSEIEAREQTRNKYFRELYVEHTNDYNENVILNLHGLTTREDIALQFEGLCEKNEIDFDLERRSM
ncbi:MAG: hypothetical protein K2J20_02300 [Bacilli bacterium]|nr:hypothetical protein [Bacilli bacterium]